MPFVAGKSPKDVNRNLDKIESQITRTIVAKALFQAASVGAGIAKTLTPVDTSDLINSQFVDINQTLNGVTATVGYTVNYAAAVHESSGKLKGQPRSNGNETYWAPNGEPMFLTNAFEKNRAQIEQVFFKGLKI